MSLKKLAKSDTKMGDAVSKGVDRLFFALIKAIFKGIFMLFKAIFKGIKSLLGKSKSTDETKTP